jgi:hypothetical protein
LRDLPHLPHLPHLLHTVNGIPISDTLLLFNWNLLGLWYDMLFLFYSSLVCLFPLSLFCSFLSNEIETIGKEYSFYQIPEFMNGIISSVKPYGEIGEKRFYFDSTKSPKECSSFHNSSQYQLIDCPTNGKKKSLDKKMLVDILSFAWDCVHHQRSSFVVLVTADEDYSYVLLKLRDLGVKTILIHGSYLQEEDLSEILLDCCDISLSLEETLCQSSTSTSPSSSYDLFDLVSEYESDDDEIESLYGVNIEFEHLPNENHLSEEEDDHHHWTLSPDDPILPANLDRPFLDTNLNSYSLFSPFKGFSDLASTSLLDNRPVDQLSSPSLGTYNLWQSRPSNDLFYLLHSSCLSSSG